jgi:AraC family transcriptional regulator
LPLSVSEKEALRAEEAKAEAIALAKAHLSAIAFIEERLFEPMSVKTIAASSGFSPSRFSRGFTRLQGESVMAYVRGRRLEGAMRRILTEPGVRIVDLAFDCGFDSQEAFTRAFARAFGQTPGRFQRSGATRPLVRKRKPLTENLIIHESVAQRPEIRLAGLQKHFTPATFVEMPDLWQQFFSIIDYQGQSDGRELYGVFRKRYLDDGSFDFLVAIRADHDRSPPEPLELLSLPARTYLVFRHMPQEGDLYPQMTAAEEAIWSERLPRSGGTLAEAPDFRLYSADFKIKGGWIDHYLPIEPCGEVEQ